MRNSSHVRSRSFASKKIAIIGGGISGLCCAYRLAERGHRVAVFESSPTLGGLGRNFQYGDLELDCFYHTVLNTDDELLRLLRELDLESRLHWTETKMGFYSQGRAYAFDSPWDLLRFDPLSLPERLRTGLFALYMNHLVFSPERLDEVTACEWLKGLFGPAVFRKFWAPLLRAKFGEAYTQVPAYWVWSTVNREKNGRKEIRGSLEGGFPILIRELARRIRDRGGEIHLNFPVDGIQANDQSCVVKTRDAKWTADAAVVALPIQSARRLGGLRWPERAALAHQGVVNAVVISRSGFQPYYWAPAFAENFSFQGVVETTKVIPPESLGGRHLIYLMNYCAVTDPFFRMSDQEVKTAARAGLQTLSRDFDLGDIEDIRIFRAAAVEPIWRCGYLKERHAVQPAEKSIYLCCTDMAYPHVTSWNTMIRLAGETVERLHATI